MRPTPNQRHRLGRYLTSILRPMPKHPSLWSRIVKWFEGLFSPMGPDGFA